MRRANSQRILKETTTQNELCKTATKSPSRPLLRKNSETDFVHVKKWIDYSSKYGIGYLLSNGSTGVYFNDSSKMLAFNQDEFFYFEKVAKEDVCRRYSFSEYSS